MKQFILALALVSFIYKGVSAQTNTLQPPKISAATKQFLWRLEKQNPANPIRIDGYAYKTDAQNIIYISAIIKVNNGFDGSAINALGAHINTKAGNIWTVQVPLNKITDFTRINGIKYIEMDQPVSRTLDSARHYTHADSVQKGYGLPQGYTGKNVVVGVVDESFDYTHPTFYDTLYKSYRIKRVWEEKNTTGPGPSEFGFSYGTEFTDSASILTEKYDPTGVDGTHGTHVTGIAAGSGYGSSSKESRFRGMAFGSDIVLVAIDPTLSYWLTTSMTDMVDGINYLFKYGQSVNKPVVANMSWGCPLGPRDGTSLFSQAVNNLVGPGKIFVISAGNNGNTNIHLKKTFSYADTVVSTFMTFPAGTPTQTNMIDIWGDSAQTFCIRFSLYNNTKKIDSSAVFCLDDSTHQINLIGSNKDTLAITLTAVASDFNDKSHILLQLVSKVTDSLCLTIKSDTGKVNMWQGYVLNNGGYYGDFQSNGYPWASNGDNVTTISDLATTQSAITVGSYNSKVIFTNVSNQELYYPGASKGTISTFSSLGPAADGRTKPDITAPGMALASSVSAYDSSFLSTGSNYNTVIAKYVSSLNGHTYSYALEAGTSMSSPALAGIVALLLQANPNLSPQEVMTILKETAIKDNFTGTIPANGSNTWGFGKVNAYQAMKKVLETEGIFHLPASTLNCLLYPNPNNGNYAIEYISNREETLSFSVFDISGQQLIKENWPVQTGDNTRQFSLSSYPTGVYFTQVNGKNGIATIKIVKQ